jgi:hypothetical protein
MSTSQGADDATKQALEAAKRSEALLSQIAAQLQQQGKVLDKQGQVLKTQAQTSKQIRSLKTDLSFKASSSRSSKIKSEMIRKHAEPLEQVQDICASASAALSGHISGEEPLTAEQLEAVKNNLDEGERLCEVRLSYHEVCDKKGIEVADEMLLIQSESERDPSELAVEKEAVRRVQEKRKASALAAKNDGDSSSEFKSKGRPFSWKQPPPFNPLPAFLSQPSRFPLAKRPAFPSYPSLPTYPGANPQFPSSQPVPSPYPAFPGFPQFGTPTVGSGASGARGMKKTFQGPCWSCEQYGHQSADCPMAASVAANAGRFSL